METSEKPSIFCVPKVFFKIIIALLLIGFSVVASWIYINNYLQETKAIDNGAYCTSRKVGGICLPKSCTSMNIKGKKYVSPKVPYDPKSCTKLNPICCVLRK